MALRRITKELKDYEAMPIENVSAGPVGDNVYKWNATILAPSDTPFKNGIFFLEINFPRDYPFKPPLIKFTTKIFHPQIERNGTVCFDILGSNWSPALNVWKVLLKVYRMVCKPFSEYTQCGCCTTIIDEYEARERAKTANHKALKLYFENNKLYKQTANEWAVKYADAEPLNSSTKQKNDQNGKTITNKKHNIDNNVNTLNTQVTQQKVEKVEENIKPVVNEKVNENLLLEIINSQLGFEVNDIIDALNKTNNMNANVAVEYLLNKKFELRSKQNDDGKENKENELNNNLDQNYSLMFLKEFINDTCKRPEYLNNFIENGCDDIALLEYIGDEELENDMKIKKKFHRKIILKNIEEFNKERNEFKQWFITSQFLTYDLKLIYKNIFEKNRILTWKLLNYVIKHNKKNLKVLIKIDDDGLVKCIFDQVLMRSKYQSNINEEEGVGGTVYH